MSRRLTARLNRLEDAAPKAADVPMCVHHGEACGLGTVALPEVYVLAIQARRRLGMDAPPVDEHRLATPAEAARYRQEVAEALAEAKARNDRMEAALRCGQSI
ncbi:hypothetical protein ACF09I_35650 [Streptomyces sp. NPDC014940]|uniref:hypothetical protein n=1 Tax=Streptomyces sp. NPDC014940 TaxID=3364932 RepID=UPI0036F93387